MTAPARVVTSLEEHDALLEGDEARQLEQGIVSSRIVGLARRAGGHELRLWRATSRGRELVKTILPEALAELEAGGAS